MTPLYDSAGSLVSFGRKLGDGGEGAVYEAAGRSDRVIKLYHAHRRPDADKAAKLAAMVSQGTPELLSAAAWPIDLLHERVGAVPVGLVMPKAAGRELHDLYGTGSRRQFFPAADWRFLVRTARNVAATFDTLHRHAIVLGDVNQRNANVADDATVRLMDCDSFQISQNGRVWRCEVGVPQFTPPELQGSRFEQVTRTPNHDRFGLAVLIFHLLCVGYHPFMGRYPRLKEPLRIEEAIRRQIFTFGANAARHGAEPPRGTPTLSELSPEVASLFERAFSAAGTQPGARPTAGDWCAALAKLEANLRGCDDDLGHFYAKHNAACPWCRIESAGGASFFVSVSIARGMPEAAGARFDVAAVWARICAVPPPQPPAGIPAAAPVTARPLPPIVDENRALRRMIAGVAGVSTLAIVVPKTFLFGVILATVFWGWWILLLMTAPLRRERSQRRAALQKSRTALQQSLADREQLLGDAQRRFGVGLESLRRTKKQYEELPEAKRLGWNALQENARETQLRDHLRRHVIWHANVPNIGTKRAATLAAYGIETAADVEAARVMGVPGFGPGLTSDLLIWRHSIESRFRYDARRGVPRAERDAFELQYRKRTLQHERVLMHGEFSLRSILADYDRKLTLAQDSIAAARTAFAQAEADWLAARGA